MEKKRKENDDRSLHPLTRGGISGYPILVD